MIPTPQFGDWIPSGGTAPIRQAVVRYAGGALCQIESDGANRSPFIDAITADAGSPEASSWCALLARAAWKACGASWYGDGACETWLLEGQARKLFIPAALAQPGDVILFGLDPMQPGHADHCGILVRRWSSFLYTVEGNTNDFGGRQGDGCYLHRWLILSPHILGAVSLGA